MRLSNIMMVAIFLTGCSEKELAPISGSLGKPGVVTQVQVEPKAGGAIVTFQTPGNKDILGVKALYTLSNGKEVSALASFYDNKLLIEGFNDENVHEAKLFTLNRAQELSDPVSITFTPLKSDVRRVSESMTIEPDFGGPRFSWENENKAPVTIEMYVPDSMGVLGLSKVIATSSLAMFHVVRGYDAMPIPVAALVRDRFGNVSDTIYPGGKLLTPLFETKIAKSTMKMHMLMAGGDVSYNYFDGADSYLIDDDLDNFGHSVNGSMPGPLTIDLGQLVKLSRFTLHSRDVWGHAFSWGNVKEFEVYGRAETPSPDGNWAEWTQLLKTEVVKPSGLPGTDVTPEDIAQGLGFDFIIPIEHEPVRYFRFKVLSTWSETTFAHIAEFDFFGQVVNE